MVKPILITVFMTAFQQTCSFHIITVEGAMCPFLWSTVTIMQCSVVHRPLAGAKVRSLGVREGGKVLVASSCKARPLCESLTEKLIFKQLMPYKLESQMQRFPHF